MDLPSRLDYFQIGRKYVIDNAKKIDPKQVDTIGSDANIYVGVASVMAEHLTNQLAYRSAALLVDGAEDDDDLNRVIYDRFQLLPKGAANGVCTIRIRRDTTTAGAGAVEVGTVVSAANVDYVTTTTATFGATQFESVCDVRSVNAGAATRIAPGAITNFQKPESLFDRTLVPTNEVASAGNEDAETADQFRSRSKLAWKAQRRGILPAIEFGALEVPGVVSATAFEYVDPTGNAARLVNLCIADSTGTANQTLAKLVLKSLSEWRAAGITVLISTSLPQLIAIQLALSFLGGVDTDLLAEQIRGAITSFVNTLPVNGTLYLGELYSVLARFRSDGLLLNQQTIIEPVGDLLPEIGKTLRIQPSNILLAA